MQTVTVLGASSFVGKFLLPLLIEKGFFVQALSRKAVDSPQVNIAWHQIVANGDDEGLALSEIAIHLAPIWTLPDYLPQLVKLGLKRLIVFSSTSRFTKIHSQSAAEQQWVAKVIAAEQAVAGFCEQHQIQWTILRPTLIYGDLHANDYSMMGKGLASIVKFINWFQIFPLAGSGKGLRQPVYAGDLARACLNTLNNPNTYAKSYNLSGGEIIDYRQMVIRIFDKLQRKPRLITLPVIMIRALLALIKLAPRYRFLTLEMANRMNQDMVFEHQEAYRDFGYQPKKFLE